MKRTLWLRGFLALLVAGLAALAWVVWMNGRGESPITDTAGDFVATPQQVARGAYLARAGNCAACHTTRGGAAYAGGLGLATPFGTVFASNLTPDPQTGLGLWSAQTFWRAMHHGRAPDGRLLYPAFPYTSYTLVSREDSDALFAYLRSLAPVSRRNTPHALVFPFNTQAALAVWRALYFRPGAFEQDPTHTPEWNRGAYLVRGLGHCAACHAPRNALGATVDAQALHGGMVAMQNWYAPSLASSREAGVADWDTQHVVDLLQTGMSARGTALGPMAEVVYRSTQHLLPDDLRAMAVFLKDLPPQSHPAQPGDAPGAAQYANGQRLYVRHCAECHGRQGEGAQGAYPPLAGNRVVTMDTPANLVQLVLHGGYLPATAGNPRPYGMPPFRHLLDDAEVADVLSYIRHAWGHRASPVTMLDVLQYQ